MADAGTLESSDTSQQQQPKKSKKSKHSKVKQQSSKDSAVSESTNPGATVTNSDLSTQKQQGGKTPPAGAPQKITPDKGQGHSQEKLQDSLDAADLTTTNQTPSVKGQQGQGSKAPSVGVKHTANPDKGDGQAQGQGDTQKSKSELRAERRAKQVMS